MDPILSQKLRINNLLIRNDNKLKPGLKYIYKDSEYKCGLVHHWNSYKSIFPLHLPPTCRKKRKVGLGYDWWLPPCGIWNSKVATQDRRHFSSQHSGNPRQCLQDLDELKISETFDKIRKMTHASFSSLIKLRLKENALKYLLGKRKSKGKEIIYPNLEMADYLLPTNEKLTIEEKRNLFAIRNRMVEISSNFSKSEHEPTCVCGEI